MFSFMANTSGHFYKNFQGFTYCSVFKVLCCRLSDSSFTITQLHSLVNNFFKCFLNFTCCLKGRSLFSSFVPVDQGHGISYHPPRQKSTPFLQSFYKISISHYLILHKCFYICKIICYTLVIRKYFTEYL